MVSKDNTNVLCDLLNQLIILLKHCLQMALNPPKYTDNVVKNQWLGSIFDHYNTILNMSDLL